MQLTPKQVTEIVTHLTARIRDELQKANDSGDIKPILDKYEVTYEPEPVPVFTKNQKILILGDISGKKNHYVKAAEEVYGIKEENIDFETDYSKLGRFDTTSLRDSNIFSDIILGPVPHKQVGIGDNSSLAAAVEKEPHRYPRLLMTKDMSKPLSKSEFLELLGKTRYVQTLREES